jgi:hypothetical protein
MPKWKGEHNPIDDPSMRDLMEGKDVATLISQHLQDLSFQVNDSYREEYGTPIRHPDDLLVELDEIRDDILVLPEMEQEPFLRSIKRLEQDALLQYAPIVKQWVSCYGRSLNGLGRSIDLEEIKLDLDAAKTLLKGEGRETAKALDTVAEEEIWLDHYLKDPAMYLVRSSVDRLKLQFPHYYFNQEQDVEMLDRAIGTKAISQEQVQEVAKLKELIAQLQECVGQVTEEEMAVIAAGISQSAIERANRHIAYVEGPQTYTLLSVELHALSASNDAGEDIQSALKLLTSKIDSFYTQAEKNQWFASFLFQAAKRLKMQAKQLSEGGEPDFETNDPADTQMALALFGITELPSEAELKRLYRLLAKRYHTDKGGLKERMQAINIARDTLLRVIKSK